MVAQAPDTKLSEVFEYFSKPSIKDLKPFGDLGKKKAELKRSLEQFSGQDPFAAYTGLGILATYENNLRGALEYLRKAYNITNKNAMSSMNYAYSLVLNEKYSEAVEIYLNVIKNCPNDASIFVDIVNMLERYYFIDECYTVINLVSGIDIEIVKSQNYRVDCARERLLKMNTIQMNIDFIRKFINATENTFYENFTATTSFFRDSEVDSSHKSLFFSYKIPLLGNDLDFMSELVADMNDSLQDKLIHIIKTSNIENAKLLAKQIYLYFVINTEGSIDNVDAA